MIRVLHKISLPEKQPLSFTARELAKIFYIQSFVSPNNIPHVFIPKSGRKIIWRTHSWRPMAFSGYMYMASYSDIDWTKVEISYGD